MLIRKTLRRTQPMCTQSTHKKVAAFGAASLLALTAACGSAEDSSDGGDDDKSTTSTSGGELTEANFATAISDAQVDKKSAHVEMSATAELEGETMDMDFVADVEATEDPADAKMGITMSIPMLADMMPGLDEIEMRLVDQIAYMKMGEATEDKFVKIDLSDGENPLGSTFDDMSKNMDPSKMVKEFDGAVKSLEKTDETEELDGVETNKYEMVIDMNKVEDSIADLGSGMAGAQGDMKLPDELPVDLWLSEDNLLYKMAMEIPDMNASVDMTMSNWGEPVDVEAPSDDEITEESPFGSMMSEQGAA